MTIATEIHEKVRAHEKRARTFFFLIGKIITIVLFTIPFFKSAIQGLPTLSAWGADTFIFVVVIAVLIYLLSFGISLFEERFISKASDDVAFRKKILHPKKFIEGDWFIGTVKGSEIIEYAVVNISYSDGVLNLHGELFRIKNTNGKAHRFGSFDSLVGDFFSSGSKYIYAYERMSDIEKNDAHYASIGGESFGKGEYKFVFDPLENSFITLHGDYFDPVSDSIMQLRGISISHMKKKLELSNDINLSADTSVEQMHEVFVQLYSNLTLVK